MTDRTLALALGGGGAAGLGHISVLEALDDLGIRPVAVAGTSMGALLGACYCSGMTGRDIRAAARDLADNRIRTTTQLFGSVGFGGWVGLPALDPLKVLNKVLPDSVPERFEDLDIPLTVIATDYHMRRETRFASGELRPAIAGSIAIPGPFRPIRIGDAVYTDGGVTNNLPYDVLPEADITLAVDVASGVLRPSTEIPRPIEVGIGAIRGMMQAMLEIKLQTIPLDVLIRPQTRRYFPLDFDKASTILTMEDDAGDKTKEALAKLV